jgi:hypothetical protein
MELSQFPDKEAGNHNPMNPEPKNPSPNHQIIESSILIRIHATARTPGAAAVDADCVG